MGDMVMVDGEEGVMASMVRFEIMADGITRRELAEMREWIGDCMWADLEPEDVADLSDDAVVRGVHRFYYGGVSAFLADCAEVAS